jgi:PAS domain S-box-containing protein
MGTEDRSEQASLFQILVDHVEDFAIFLLDTRGKVATWNKGAEKVFGYVSTEILGEHFSIFYLPEEIHGDVPANELETARTQGRASDDRWLVRKDGRRIWVRGVTVCLSRGGSCDFGKIVRDDTELQQREQEIKKLNTQLQQTVERLERSEADLQERVRDMESFEDAVVGRELKMIEVEKENAALRVELQKLREGTP